MHEKNILQIFPVARRKLYFDFSQPLREKSTPYKNTENTLSLFSDKKSREAGSPLQLTSQFSGVQSLLYFKVCVSYLVEVFNFSKLSRLQQKVFALADFIFIIRDSHVIA